MLDKRTLNLFTKDICSSVIFELSEGISILFISIFVWDIFMGTYVVSLGLLLLVMGISSDFFKADNLIVSFFPGLFIESNVILFMLFILIIDSFLLLILLLVSFCTVPLIIISDGLVLLLVLTALIVVFVDIRGLDGINFILRDFLGCWIFILLFISWFILFVILL